MINSTGSLGERAALPVRNRQQKFHSKGSQQTRWDGQEIEAMAESKTTAQQTPDTNPIRSSASEFPCPDCGELVREGLVRCWNCGGFLRPELEETFQKIQSRPQRIIYSPPTEDERHEDVDALLAGPAAPAAAEAEMDEDTDFQLAGTRMRPVRPLTGVPLSEEEAESQSAESPPSEAEEVPHSIASGGDVLLQLAAQEEIERLRRKVERGNILEGVRQIRDGFLIDAPKGCRIQIRDEHTGEMRRLTFGGAARVRISLLDKLAAIQKAEAARRAEGEAAGPKHLSAGVYQRWMSDCHLHTLNPEKLKLKADSLAKEFVPVELGFAADSLLVASLPPAKAKKGGLFGGGKTADTGPDSRTALLEHFRAGKSLSEAPAGDKKTYSADQVAQLRVVQPTASPTESLFHGIPVFGAGRIAVQLPIKEGELPQFLSFTLSEFREFADIIGSLYSLAEFGRNLGIPLVDSFTEHKCHLSGSKIRALEYVSYYQADPKFELVTTGWLCSSCGIAISEEARENQKLGGKGGKGIAKAKCPNEKCGQKLGSNPLYTLKSAAASPESSEDESAEQPAAS